MAEQLPLRVSFREDAVFEDFLPGQNASAVGTLRQALARLDQHLIVLWGGPGAGVSHLLQAAVNDLHTQGLNAIYLPISECFSHGVGALDGLSELDAIALDDMQLVEQDTQWQEAIFHLYNQLKDSGKLILIGLKSSPLASDFRLADLKSRLSSGLTLQLQRMTDEERIDWLIWKGRRRGLIIERDVSEFLIHRHNQNVAELERSFEVLDSASLAEKRKITIPFLKKILNI